MSAADGDDGRLARGVAPSDPAAGTGLGGRPARRRLLAAGVALAAGAAAGARAAGERSAAPPSWRTVGGGFSNRGEAPAGTAAIRWISADPAFPGAGASWTPLHALEGTITPNALAFERHHGGVPAIDGAGWSLLIEGAVARPLALDLDALARRPLRSHLAFIECGGNSGAMWRGDAPQQPAGWLHGLVSSGEWTGVALATLLEESGADPEAGWLVASGLDAGGVTVSLPRERLPADTLVALYRNGEPLLPEHGWPARLLVPGWEGICNVKWLGRLELARRPAMSRYDTVSYTELDPDGRARRFSHRMGVKSAITHPVVGERVASGALGVGGLAWSGAGAIARVELSVDGGQSWAEAELEGAATDRAFTRFRQRLTRRAGETMRLMSRATDTEGRVQPTRAALLALRGPNAAYHYNAILALALEADGRVVHVHG